MTILNLTPHPLHIYPPNTPDRIEPGSVTPVQVIRPSTDHPSARLGQQVLGEDDGLDVGVPVERVHFGPEAGTVTLPDPVEGIWYVVALVVGLAAFDRRDLLVPHDYVRDLDGSIIGSRKLARPHHA